MAETKVKKENMEFQTEVNQLLQLMIHSLYSNKEIFLRELVSNASDACDKLRFEAISDDSLYEGDSELRIEVDCDEDKNTVTIRDNGIGMNREEVIRNIGTIAKSGTKEFLSKLSGDAAKDSNLIGQFGVGFYSSFIVADKVVLTTRKAGDKADQAVVWESNGESGFSLEDTTKETHGTEIVLYLKEEEKEFANDYRLRNIISTYSDHIPLPVKMFKRDEEGTLTDEREVVNKANAVWAEAKSSLKDEDYQSFYKHITLDWENPMAWSHNHVEGKLEYKSLLYVPSKAPLDLWEAEQTNGIKLYVQRVYIMDDTKNFMPQYLRFMRGVIDSNDLPLNVSREILQTNQVVDSMRKASVKKVLDLIEKMAKNDKEKYQKFWSEFGRVLKEGPGEDMANKEQIARLIRFSSTETDTEEQTVSLEDYVSRMKDEQEHIFYITAETFLSAKNSPHLEVFRKKQIEVLLLSDRVDEWLVNGLQEFNGKKLQSISKGELDLSKFDTEEDKKEREEIDKKADSIIKHLKEVLNNKVDDVRVSHRLTSSPSCIVLSEKDMALYMQTLMKQAGHEMTSNKPVLEINPTHPLIARMEAETDDEQFADWAEILFDQALLAEGAQLEDPAGFVNKLNKLMMKMS